MMATKQLIRLTDGTMKIASVLSSYSGTWVRDKLRELRAPGDVQALCDKYGRVHALDVYRRTFQLAFDGQNIATGTTVTTILAALTSGPKIVVANLHWADEAAPVTQLLNRLEQAKPMTAADIELFTLVCIAFLIRPRNYAAHQSGVFTADGKRTQEEMNEPVDVDMTKRSRVDDRNDTPTNPHDWSHHDDVASSIYKAADAAAWSSSASAVAVAAAAATSSASAVNLATDVPIVSGMDDDELRDDDNATDSDDHANSFALDIGEQFDNIENFDMGSRLMQIEGNQGEPVTSIRDRLQKQVQMHVQLLLQTLWFSKVLPILPSVKSGRKTPDDRMGINARIEVLLDELNDLTHHRHFTLWKPNQVHVASASSAAADVTQPAISDAAAASSLSSVVRKAYAVLAAPSKRKVRVSNQAKRVNATVATFARIDAIMGPYDRTTPMQFSDGKQLQIFDVPALLMWRNGLFFDDEPWIVTAQRTPNESFLFVTINEKTHRSEYTIDKGDLQRVWGHLIKDYQLNDKLFATFLTDRHIFSAADERLWAYALRIHNPEVGADDEQLMAIQNRFLPGKTIDELTTKWKKIRQQPQLSMEPVTHLRDFTDHEWQAVLASRMVWKDDPRVWSLISQNVLPHWPRKLLAKAWNKRQRKIARQIVADDKRMKKLEHEVAAANAVAAATRSRYASIESARAVEVAAAAAAASAAAAAASNGASLSTM